MRKMGWMGGSGRTAAVALAIFAAGAAPAQKAQDVYNAAQAAFDKGDWAAAVAGFEKVAGNLAQAPRNRAEATIRSRLAQAYLYVGRSEDARTLAAQAISALDPTDVSELASAYAALGDASRYALDMTTALDAYDRAIKLTPPGPDGDDFRLLAQLGIAEAAMTVDPARAAAALDVVLAHPTVATAKSRDIAQLEMLRGRAAMNQGDLANARRFLNKALLDSGGLSGTNVNHAQIAIRSDGAIASQLQGDAERTRELLTWTGAGHTSSQDWTEGVDAKPPVCGDATGLRETDTAVVEFVIADDGHVIAATPVYSSRPGPQSLEFARAVRDWRWTQAAAAKLEPFWRAAARTQIRCVSRPKPLSLEGDFRTATIAWLRAKGLSERELEPLAEQANPPAKDDPRLTREDASSIPVRLALVGPGGNRALAAQLDRALDAADAPADVHAYVINARAGDANASRRVWARTRAAALGEAIGPFEARFARTRAAAWLRLEQALALENAGALDDARPALAAVLSAPEAAVGATDPIRQIATLHLAALDRERGDAAAADARIAASGLSADQCSLFDVRPAATNTSIGSEAFPAEALRWGFTGYVRESFDIAADGSVTNVRAVLAYPPFVFERATDRAVARFRYLPPTIAGSPAGCHGQSLNVRFRL